MDPLAAHPFQITAGVHALLTAIPNIDPLYMLLIYMLLHYFIKLCQSSRNIAQE